MQKETLHKVLATGTVLLGLFIAAMESLIGSTILPSILASLGGFDLYPWMVSAFLLALVVTTPLFGKLADHMGFYPIYLAAIGIFMIGSLGCGLSQTMPQMIVARCIQGIGTAGLINLCMLYVGLAFPLNMRHKLGALVSSVWALASLLGPAIGAVIAAYSSWRFAFLINVPLCLLLLISGRIYLRHLPKPQSQGPFDIKGAMLFTFGTIALLISMIRMGKGESGAIEWALFLLSAALFTTLFFHSKKIAHGFLSLKPLLTYPHVGISMGIGALCGAFLFSTSNLLPLFIQGAQGEPIRQVGYVVTSMALGTCTGSFLTAMLLGRIGFRNALLVSFCFLTIGLTQLMLITYGSSFSSILIANFILGTGIGMSSNCSIVATQSFSPRSKLGVHTGLFGFFRSVGGMLIISILGTVQLLTFRNEVAKETIALQRTEAIEALQHPEYILEESNREKLSASVLATLEQSLATSIHWALVALGPLLLVHLALALRMPNTKPHEIQLIPEPESIGE